MPRERDVTTVIRPDWGQTEVVTARQLLKVLRISSPRAAVPELGSGKHSCRESVGPAVWPLQAHLGLHTCTRAHTGLPCHDDSVHVPRSMRNGVCT